MSLFKDQLAEIVANTELEHDDWFEEAFSLYLNKNSNKTKGVKKYTRDIQLIEEITVKIKDTFRNHIKKVLQDEEDYISTMESVQSELALATDNFKKLQTQFDALNEKYKMLQNQDSRGQELTDQLRKTNEQLLKTIEEKNKQIDQNGKLLQKFEKLELDIKTYKNDEPEILTIQSIDRKAEREGKKLEKANKIKNQKPPIPAGNFEIKTVTETTELLKQQYDLTDGEEEKEERKNYGTTLSAAEFNIKNKQDNNVQE